MFILLLTLYPELLYFQPCLFVPIGERLAIGFFHLCTRTYWQTDTNRLQ